MGRLLSGFKLGNLSFDFEPKILTITSAWTESGANRYATAQYYQITIYIAAVQSALVGSNGATVWGLFNADTHRDVITMTTAGQTVSWYSFTNDNEQLNNDQYTYYYIAIG